MIMYPPCHRLPRYILVQAINQPRHNDGGHRTHTTILAALVPDVAGSITLVRGATAIVLAAERVDHRRAIGRPDAKAPKDRLQRLKQVLAQHRACSDRQAWIIRQIRQSMDLRDVAIEEIAHEKRAGEPNAAEVLDPANRS